MESGHVRIETNRKVNEPRPSSAEEDGRWYYHGPNKSKRFRYKFCGQCGYKTYSKPLLLKHVKLHHPTASNTVVIIGHCYPILLTFDQV